nr:immunoglobulin light chain junction region [Macaca mulatta]MOX11774.1 immunoglobulin light chain junction region [Macaca mulatta]MOX12173.1 immunoglobulin light chain junction region [Macaca mulatta]MOX13096.1 immunoglobulin light chain junction region [Macaca mulatta]MOX13311.1 immunoglobulin light chain junction region [Macaca mulatta]
DYYCYSGDDNTWIF